MSGKHPRILVFTTTLAVLAIGGTLAKAAKSGDQHTQLPRKVMQHLTPNDCIRMNGGDFNACNVGHTGAGNRPYDIARDRTPNECILLNGGDYTACNVGNSGAGNLPYRHPAADPS